MRFLGLICFREGELGLGEGMSWWCCIWLGCFMVRIVGGGFIVSEVERREVRKWFLDLVGSGEVLGYAGEF